MSLEIEGKIIQILPKQSGTSKNGNWTKQECIIETMEQFPKKVCITLWGEKFSNFEQLYPINTTIKANINIESREYMGRWYTDVRAWSVSPINNNTAPQQQILTSQIADNNETGWTVSDDTFEDDPLPF